MVKVIGAILTNNKKDATRRIKLLRSADLIQFDVMDGKFVPGKTIWAKDISSFKLKEKSELHLMIEHPENHLSNFIKCQPQRIIFHYKSTKKIPSIIKRLRKAKIKVGIAINPEVSIKKLKPYINKIDFVLIMTVHPGKQGQKFLKSMLKKIKDLRKISDIDIGVDGGVNLITANLAVKAGATTIASGSYLVKVKNPTRIIKRLKRL